MRRIFLKLLRRRRMEKDLEAELAFHEEMARAGGNAIGLGNRGRVKEHSRDVWRWAFVENAWRDLARGMRRLGRAPTFTAAAILTLALAIGANAAIFTLVHRVVLNPLPYPESNRLIDLDHAAPGANFPRGLGMTLGLYFHYRERSRTIEDVALYRLGEATLTGRRGPERIRISVVTPSLGPVLGVAALRGRWFVEDEAAPGAPLVAVLSHALWSRRYGGAPDVVGQAVVVDGAAAEIIGVMPPSFAFPGPEVELWIPLRVARTMAWNPFSHAGIALLREGMTVEDARDELSGLIRELRVDYPDDAGVRGLVENAGLTSVARPLKERVIGNVTDVLWLLLASVVFVLLVACANVANLFLVRSETRQRELGVRRALGAGRAAVARYFAAESLLISAGGVLFGLAIAWGAVHLVTRFGPSNLPRLQEVRLDPTVIAVASVLGLVAAVVLGAVGVLGASPLKGLMAASVHERGNTASTGRLRMRHLLMGGQVALALMLFIAAGLMFRSFQNLRAIDPGFDPASTLAFRIGLPESDYTDAISAVRAHQEILDALSAVPGVNGASASARIPLSGPEGGFSSPARVEGRVAAEDTIPPIVEFSPAAGGYFETMQTPVLRGRGIERGDVERNEPIAVVNEAFVAAYLPGLDPIGARVAADTGPQLSAWLTIVGVVGNTPFDALPQATTAEARPEVTMPMSIAALEEVGSMGYVVRSSVPPLELMDSVRRAIDTVDGNLAVAQLRTLQDLVDDASRQTAFTMVLVAIAAAVALMLGLVGIYGLVAYVVTQRTNEIGVRLALGAEPRGVTALIVRRSGIVTLAGIAAGVVLALAGGRLIEALLYGIRPDDPGVLVVAAVALFAFAIVACWLPARRAARIDPAEALRAD